jgi:uncharacterized protein YndB with AHSA1/START domain
MRFEAATLLVVSTLLLSGVAFLAGSADHRTPSQAPRLRIQRTFSVAPDNVFRAWTDAESIKRWFPYKAKVYWSTAPTVDANVGGHFNWSVASKDGELEVFHFHGTYREYRGPRMLSFTWEWESLPISGVEGPGTTLVTLKFVPAGEGIIVILTQTGFASQAARQAHEKGWNRCFDGIEHSLPCCKGSSVRVDRR